MELKLNKTISSNAFYILQIIAVVYKQRSALFTFI